MRSLAGTLVVVGAVMGAALIASRSPAYAQTYDPAYPVCMHIYGDQEGDRIDCIYTSLAQCRAGAAGRAAMCLDNPYWVPPARPSRSQRPRHSSSFGHMDTSPHDCFAALALTRLQGSRGQNVVASVSRTALGSAGCT